MENIADNAAFTGAERQAAWDRSAPLYSVVSHRDHLFRQVTELQASNAALTERARAAEVRAEKLGAAHYQSWDDALHLASLLDEFGREDFVFLDPTTHALVVRLLKAAGKPVTSTAATNEDEPGESAEKAESELAERREPASRSDCMDCGLAYGSAGFDLVLPREHWLLIHPDDGGVLCANCVVARAQKLPGGINIMGRVVFGATYEAEWKRLDGPATDGAALFEELLEAGETKPTDPLVLPEGILDAAPAEETAPAQDCGECNGSGARPGHGDPCVACEGMGKLCGECDEPFGDEHVCTPEVPLATTVTLCEVCDEPVDPNDPDRATLIDDDGTAETCGTCVRNRRIGEAMIASLGIDSPTPAEREQAFLDAITPGPPPYIPTAEEVRIAGEAFEAAGVRMPAGRVKLKGMSLADCFRGSDLDVEIALNALAKEGAVLVDTTTPAHRALATCDVISCQVHRCGEGDDPS